MEEDNLHDAEAAAELQRVREVSRYYFSTPGQWTEESNQPAPAPEDGDNCAVIGITAPGFKPKPPQLPVDSSLTAYAQLGALKLDCERAFISLIDHDRQYILAEATRSLSLEKLDHKPDDGLFIGSQVLPVHWGVCPSTIRTFTDPADRYSFTTPNIIANKSRYIIKDFTQEEKFRSRSYVAGYPYFRSYAEVPMKNAAGFVIGTYCVIDSRPRAEFSEKEIEFLQEIANAISSHLELTRMKLDYARAERLMKGLGCFVEGSSSLRAQVAITAKSPGFIEPGHRQKTPLPKKENQEQEPSPKADRLHPADSPSLPAAKKLRMGDMSPVELSNVPSRPLLDDEMSDSQDSVTFVEPATSIPNSSESRHDSISPIEKIFQRASTLIRESMDLSGVVFHDAYHNGLSSQSALGQGSRLGPDPVSPRDILINRSIERLSPRIAISSHSGSASPCGPSSFKRRRLSEPEKSCDVLGFSTKAVENPLDWTPSIPVSLLQNLLSAYPHGHIFIREDSDWAPNGRNDSVRSCSWSSISEADASLFQGRKTIQDSVSLFDVFPNACSIVFYPLWDSQKSRWCSGCFGWTKDPRRALQNAEVNYLAAFGNSIMAELGRIEAVATGKAKTDFISNISHELRSPLHGILASAELLQESSTGLEQDRMIEMVNNCGRTLLETMSHLLDYAKINNFSKSKTSQALSSKGAGKPQEQMTLVTDFDLRQLVEEVVEVVHTGFNFQKSISSQFSHRPSQDYQQCAPTDVAQQDRTEDCVQVILDVGEQADWTFTSQAGAWRRLIMNLFGNALKYTSNGFIQIKVRLKEPERFDDGPATVSLSIIDTGKGISEDYLKNRLFTPFSQEDHFAVGAGLGLSIVQQIVEQMQGNIEIQSQVDSGTTVTVSIPLNRPAAAHSPQSTLEPTLSRLRPSLSGLTLCIVGLDSIPKIEEVYSDGLTLDARRRLVLGYALSRCFSSWFGLRVVNASTLDAISADIFAVEEEHLTDVLSAKSPRENSRPTLPDTPIIVLSTGKKDGSLQYKNSPSGLVQLSEPYGPSRIMQALKSCFSDRNSSSRQNASRELNDVTEFSPNEASQIGKDVAPTSMTSNPIVNVSDAHSAASKLASTPLKTPRVLLVDDNDINIKIMVTYILKLKCEYATASNGLEAVRTYQKGVANDMPFDFVLMDVSMPVMDGMTATREIRAFEEASSSPPAKIIALTGLGSDEARQEANSVGVDLFLTKPVPLKYVKEVLGLG